MTATINKHDAVRLAHAHSDLMVFLQTGQPISTMEPIERTAKDYFALTSRLGVPMHNDTFEGYVSDKIEMYRDRQREVARRVFKTAK